MVTVRTWVEELGSRGVTFGYEVVKDTEEILATGRTVHVCTDRAGNVRTIPHWVKEILGQGFNDS